MFEVSDLTVEYEVDDGRVRGCHDVSFTVEDGEVVGLMGESGCGKSTVGQAMLRLLPDNAEIVSGEILYNGQDLLALDAAELRGLRWEELAIVTQGSMDAFDPVYTIRAQIREAIQTHRDVSNDRADERVDELFELVSMEPDQADSYPHQLSGGMKQRSLIAMALALDPEFIVVDEPTTGLDVITQDTVLRELEELQERFGTSVLFISHDINIISETADRALVMYAGQIVESARSDALFSEPYHPYTLGLMNSYPDLQHDKNRDLVSIPGLPPTVDGPPDRCLFANRCPFATADCEKDVPGLESVDPEHSARCIRTDVHEEMLSKSTQRETWEQG